MPTLTQDGGSNPSIYTYSGNRLASLKVGATSTPLTANGVLSYTFYDDYNWRPTSLAYAAGDFLFSYTGHLPSPKGQLTGTKVIKVLDGNEETATATWLMNVSYYDDRYRVVQQVEELYGGGSLRVSNRYAFDGILECNREVRVFNSATNTVEQRFEYDHARRLTKTFHKVNTQTHWASSRPRHRAEAWRRSIMPTTYVVGSQLPKPVSSAPSCTTTACPQG